MTLLLVWAALVQAPRLTSEQQAEVTAAKETYRKMRAQSPADDINLQNVAVSQTSFEDAPVTLTAQVTTSGYAGRTIVAQLVDESGKIVSETALGASTIWALIGKRK